MVTTEKIASIEEFLSSNNFWLSRARNILKNEYFEELFTDSWTIRRNKAQKNALLMTFGFPVAIISAAEMAAVSPIIVYNSKIGVSIIQQGVQTSINSGASYVLKSEIYAYGMLTWLNYSTMGPWTLAAITGIAAPEGAVTTSDQEKEIIFKFIKELYNKIKKK